MVLTILIYIVIRIMISQTLYAHENTIQNVLIDPVSASYVDSPSLFGLLQPIFSWRNMTDVRRSDHHDIRMQIQRIEPFIENFDIQKQSDNTVILTLDRRIPQLTILYQNQRIARYNDDFILLSTWDLLGSWIVSISLPQYMSWESLWSWLFFHRSIESLLESITMIKSSLSGDNIIIWMPWGDRIWVRNDKSIVRFALWQSLQQQLRRYQLLLDYYPSQDVIQFIDMSNPHTIIIK